MFEYDLFYEWCKGIEYSCRISTFLTEVDDVMYPSLKERIDIDKYAYKLATKADTIFIMKDMHDIASCSLYCNLQNAFISSIAVKREFLHYGIGTFMLNEVIAYSRMKKCQKILLKVHSDNIRAMNFYKKVGFYAVDILEDWNTMEIKL